MNTSIKREKYNIKKKTIRKNVMRSLRKIVVLSKIPNNVHKILQKLRKTSKIPKNKPQNPKKYQKLILKNYKNWEKSQQNFKK